MIEQLPLYEYFIPAETVISKLGNGIIPNLSALSEYLSFIRTFGKNTASALIPNVVPVDIRSVYSTETKNHDGSISIKFYIGDENE